MAKFSEQMLDDIRGRLQVSAVIGQYVKLRKSGAEFRGVDDESLTVNDKKQLWWDHGKDEGGDIFKFLTERQGFQFPDAVERLASQAGVSMPANAGRSNGAAHRDRNDRPNGAVPRGGDPRDQESGDPGHAEQNHPGDPGGTDAQDWPAAAASSRRNVTRTYDYANGDGLLIYQTCRVEWEDRGKKKKTFMQRRPDPKGEPNVWVWGLGAGEFMRRGPGKDWYAFDEDKWDAWKCTERMAIVEAAHHTLYRLPELREAIADERVVFLCYSADTEILTENGWLPFPDLREHHRVAQWDMPTEEITFANPTALYSYDGPDEMVSVASRNFDLLVTEDHRQPTRLGNDWTPPKVRRAGDLPSHLRLPTSGLYRASRSTATGPSPLQARIITAWLADGVREPRGHKVSWNFKKTRKLDRLKELLGRQKVPFTEHEYPSTPGWRSLRVFKDDLAFVWASVGQDKVWPFASTMWSDDARKAVLDELRYWDGDTGSDRHGRFFTAERQSADTICAMAAITGHQSQIRVDRREGRNDSYVVNFSRNSWRGYQNKPQRVPYVGKVYCCTVPTGFVVVRRNGKVLISGNCEGEKDVETMFAWDMAATTNSGGARHWTEYHAELLRGADVVIPIDNDQAGRERGQKVARALRGIAKRIRLLDVAKHWPEARTKDDITDWRDRGGLTSDALYEILDKLPDWTPEPYRSKFGAIRWRDLHTSSSISYEWAIKSIVPLGENVLIYGETQTGKSFKTFDMAAAIARGVEYLGRRVRQGLVIYCAAEAGHGFPLRMTAYERHHNLQGGSDFPFVLLTRRIDIFATEQEVDELILEIQAIAEEYAMPVSAVVIDTYNAATPGAKENASEDVSLIIKRLDKIRSASRAGIWLVHHKNAAGDKPRGHTSLLANFETAIEIAPKLDLHVKPPRPVLDDDGRQIRVATVKKQREGEAGFTWEFVLPAVQIATDEDGDAVTSCVVTPPRSRTAAQETDARAVAKKRKSMGWRLSRNEDFFFRAMLAALDAHGQPPPAALRLPGSVGRVVDYEHVKAEFKKRMLHEEADPKKEADRIKTALRRSREELAQQNLLATDNPWVWPTGRRVMFRDNTFWPPLSSAEQAQARGEPPPAEPREGELNDADLEDLLKPAGGRY